MIGVSPSDKMISNDAQINKSANKTQTKVFISYAPDDYEKIKNILAKLQESYICWFETAESLTALSIDQNEHDQKLKNCQFFIPVFSHQFLSCDYCKRDLSKFSSHYRGDGENRSKIIPIFIDNITWNKLNDTEAAASLYGITIDGVSIPNISFPFYGKGIEGESHSDVCEIIEDCLRAESETNDEIIQKDVFISYAHRDKKTVKEIYSKLKDIVPNCWWFDNEILENYRDFNKSIYKGLQKCKCVIAFFSRNYAQSEYCSNIELPYARDKNIIPIFLDDISPNDFSENIRGTIDQLLKVETIYCKGKSTDEVCEKIVNTTAFKLLKSGLLQTDSKKIEASESILNQLVLNLEKQQEQKGNYKVTQDISQALFSFLKKTNKNSESSIDENEDVPEQKSYSKTDKPAFSTNNKDKYKYLMPDGWETYETPLINHLNESKHLFLTGEGGGGKTTTLIESCRWLLAQGEYAVYVPLKVINSENNFENYLKRTVFSGNSQMYHIATSLMQSDKPFYIFLDGLNEMTQDYLGTFINNLETFLLGHHAVKLIISSRFFDSHMNFGSIGKDLSLFRFQKLDRECVVAYLHACGVLDESKKDIDDTLYQLLHTPLMLTLYCFSKKAKKEYDKDPVVKDRIELEAKPDTAAKILHNYVQTQLYRAFAENNFNVSVHLVLYEYILPYIAMQLVKCNEYTVSSEQFSNLIYFPFFKPTELKYYMNYIIARARQISISYTIKEATEANEISQKQLSFIVPSESGYLFTHQMFRDFFAAKFLCMEMTFDQKSMIQDRTTQDMCGMKYSDDVLSFVADLQKEYDFEPKRDAVRNWQFEKGSVTENILAKWKNVEGELAQTAVYNLFNILRLGRNGKLFSCDFPRLDLRSCNLNGVKFSEFDKDNTYASSFEGAWIDKECFLPNGHSAPITAMCISSDNILYTGDVTGKVFRWNLNVLDKPSQSKKVDPIDDGFDVTDEKIIRLALSEENKCKLLVLTDHSVTEFDVEHGEVIKHTVVPPHKYLRDVRDNDGVIEVIYDTAPLTWRSLDDNKTDYIVDDSCPISGCVRKSPCSDVYVYSDMNGQIRTNNHGFYSLYQHLFNEIQKSGIEGSTLQDYYEMKKNPSVNDICWHPLGEKLLVAYSNTVFEFEHSANNVLKYEVHTAFDSKVTSVGYLRDGRIIVCNGVCINIIKSDEQKIMSDSGYEFSSCYTPGIIKTLQSGSKTYLLSTNKELKILDENLIVKHVRQLKRNVQDICFARDLRTKEKFLCIMIKNSRGVFCERYDITCDEYEDLNSNFKVLDDREDHSDKLYTHYRIYKKLISFNRTNSEQNEYNNVAGMMIKGCNFKNVNNNQAGENMKIIKQNGGIIANECRNN